MQSIFFRYPADSQPAGGIEGGILSVSTVGYASLYNQIIQMHKRTTSKIFARARELRREMTPVERKLWARLRVHRMQDVHFRTQHAIGNYVVDFCSVRKRLIIELDGGQHLEQEDYDKERTKFLESKGYRVLRFWNNDVTKDMDAVLNTIWEALG